MAGKNPFADIVRPRSCGIVVQNSRLLLVKIHAPTRKEPFWMPPGGGISFGETAEAAAEREVEEETGLQVSSRGLMFVSEYIHGRWHAIELYYRCRVLSGMAALGTDPEMDASSQMLEDIGWFGPEEIETLNIFPAFIQEYKTLILSGETTPVRFISQK